MDSAEREINHKLRIVNQAQGLRNISKTCRYFGISRQVYYNWKRRYDEHGGERAWKSKARAETF